MYGATGVTIDPLKMAPKSANKDKSRHSAS